MADKSYLYAFNVLLLEDYFERFGFGRLYGQTRKDKYSASVPTSTIFTHHAVFHQVRLRA
jgi:hypothetical protein